MPRIDPAQDADEPGGAALAPIEIDPIAEGSAAPVPGSGPGPDAAVEGDHHTAPAGSGPPPHQRNHRKLIAGLLISISVLLILGAVGVGGYPYYTDIQARRHQKGLTAAFDQKENLTGDARAALIQQYQDRTFATGEGITKIVIPTLNVNQIVVEGTTDAALDVGAGHYPMTPLPGQVGNVAIAGHRTMNGHPFGDLNKLQPGDQVILQTPFQTYTYKVLPAFDGHANPWVVNPDDWSVIEFTTNQSLLTLTTCNPPGQQTNRLVVRASLSSTTPT